MFKFHHMNINRQSASESTNQFFQQSPSPIGKTERSAVPWCVFLQTTAHTAASLVSQIERCCRFDPEQGVFPVQVGAHPGKDEKQMIRRQRTDRGSVRVSGWRWASAGRPLPQLVVVVVVLRRKNEQWQRLRSAQSLVGCPLLVLRLARLRLSTAAAHQRRLLRVLLKRPLRIVLSRRTSH